MATVITTTFKLRRGLAAEWASKNPVLAEGEPGFVLDTSQLKIGDGKTAWNDLAYITEGDIDSLEYIGKNTEEGGIIFNDYENNSAGLNAAAFGSETKAAGEGAFATGVKKDAAGDYPTDDNGDAIIPDDAWRYNEAVGSGSMASGMGAVAYSRASKSLGYRTQTGYPPSKMYIQNRPEVINSEDYSLSIDIGSMLHANLVDNVFNVGADGIIIFNTYGTVQRITCSYLTNPLGSGQIYIEGYDSQSNSYVKLDTIYFHGYVPEDDGSSQYYPVEKKFFNDKYTKLRFRFLIDKETSNVKIADLQFYGYPGENTGQAAVAIGSDTVAVGNNSLAGGYKTKAMSGGAIAFGSNTQATGPRALAIGSSTTASGEDSFSAGVNTTASGYASIATGGTSSATGAYSFAGGTKTNTTKTCSFGFGSEAQVDSNYSAAIGYKAIVGAKDGSFAIGYNVQSTGVKSLALGQDTIASGQNSTALGLQTNAAHYCAMAGNYKSTTGASYQTVIGKWNTKSSNDIFVVGIGSSAASANGFTVSNTGVVKGVGEYSTMGADYAEFFEWMDGNPNNEDRIGLLVALEGEKIRLAQAGDDILGIISGTAAVLGDSAAMHWKNKYLTDKFGRIIYEMVEEFAEDINEETQEVRQISLGLYPHPILNPDYSPNEEYIPREERPEWSKVGMMGKLHARDDGTCEVGQYATVGFNGILTYGAERTNMKVMKRIDEETVLVLLK